MLFPRGYSEFFFVSLERGLSDYQYHLKDHLGNVRATFKTEIDVDEYLATMEGDSANVEETYFYNLDSVRVTYASANKTALGDEAARVGQDSVHSVGPAIALSVVPGDTIDMEVWAYYEGGTGYANTIAKETFIATLAGAFGGISGAGGESGTIFEGVNEAINGGAGGLGSNTDTNVPGAYLSYILFDQNYEEIQSGYHEISSNASYAHEKLFLNDITISQAGYLYIYTSMQSKGTQPVYFDDMKVTHTHSPIVSKDDYYPFGLQYASYSRPASVENFMNTFQDQEYEKETGWVKFKWRNHQPDLGRFFNVDPLADKYVHNSPYAFSENKVVAHVELEGLEAFALELVSGPIKRGGGTGNGVHETVMVHFSATGAIKSDNGVASVSDYRQEVLENGNTVTKMKINATAGKSMNTSQFSAFVIILTYSENKLNMNHELVSGVMAIVASVEKGELTKNASMQVVGSSDGTSEKGDSLDVVDSDSTTPDKSNSAASSFYWGRPSEGSERPYNRFTDLVTPAEESNINLTSEEAYKKEQEILKDRTGSEGN